MIKKTKDGYVFDGVPSSQQADILRKAGFRCGRRGYYTTDAACVTRSMAIVSMCSPQLQCEMSALRENMINMLSLSSSAEATDLPVYPDGDLSLLPYQTSGIAYMLKAGRCLNADDMGLGKTIQGAMCIKTLFAQRKASTALVVCPASLKINWQRELKTWAGIDAHIVSSKNAPARCQVAIINYDILKKQSAWLAARRWDVLVCDESHYIKSLGAGRTKEIAKIPSEYFFALSGTPMPNNPSEMFPVLNKMRPDMFPDKWRFVNDYCYIIKEFGHMKIVGGKNLDRLKNKLRATCMVRRKKTDVLKDLPPKRRQIIEIENSLESLTKKEIDAYDNQERLRKQMKELKKQCDETKNNEGHRVSLEAFAAKTEEFRVAYGKLSSARKELAIKKVPACIEHIASVLESEEKLVVFTYHKEPAYLMQKNLSTMGVSSVCITGETQARERQESVDSFVKGDARVIIGTYGAMGTGLTLIVASTCIMTELDWVPAVLDQAEDRLVRIGQRCSVLIQYLVLDGSLDGKMIRKLCVKGRLIEQVMG
jgi:SWI/SNF-related matrix-associated actin-dependent regulator 1 of chromatin subfamily A